MFERVLHITYIPSTRTYNVKYTKKVKIECIVYAHTKYKYLYMRNIPPYAIGVYSQKANLQYIVQYIYI